MARAQYTPRFGKDMRIKPDVQPAPVRRVRACEQAGCAGEGGYRVPRSRTDLSDHMWFCLEHARAHNEKWDYFNGMSEAEIEAFRTDAVTGHRPTWPLGKRAARMRDGHDSGPRYDDRYGVFGDVAEQPRRPERRLLRPQIVALETLGLEQTATLQEIKARYKELVKRYHPDANGGDRGAEERLKQVIKAYGVLRASGLT
ncbi:MAG TPA: J domain-containing protein [Rhizomicrobium sp.]|nr:J domain-containing protein [Rhizomicrobium sp.]